MSEPSDNELKHLEIVNIIGQKLQQAGAIQHTVKEDEYRLAQLNIELKNLKIDAQKLYKEIQKEREASKKKEDTPTLELVNQDQEACVGGTDVLQ